MVAARKPGSRRHVPAPVILVASLAALAAIASCTPAARARSTTTTHPRPGTPLNPVAPSTASVESGRFVQSVELAGKTLEVSPPPKSASPSVTLAQATALFDADYAFSGTYAYDIVGLGNATLDEPETQSSLSSARSTTTTTAPKTTTTSTTKPKTTTTAPPTTTTTTTTTAPPPPPPTTTTSAPAAPTTTTTTAPAPTTTTAPPAPVLPSYDRRLAWVGIAVGQAPACAGGTPAIVAMVIDAYTGHDVLQVTDGGCRSVGPSVARPDELESIPWTLVGPTSTAVDVTIPACGFYVGWTELTVKTATLIQVQAVAPYDPQCRATTTAAKVVSLVVPLGSTSTSVPHAPIGPVDNLDVLPGARP
jgi:hypothetical protein